MLFKHKQSFPLDPKLDYFHLVTIMASTKQRSQCPCIFEYKSSVHIQCNNCNGLVHLQCLGLTLARALKVARIKCCWCDCESQFGIETRDNAATVQISHLDPIYVGLKDNHGDALVEEAKQKLKATRIRNFRKYGVPIPGGDYQPKYIWPAFISPEKATPGRRKGFDNNVTTNLESPIVSCNRQINLRRSFPETDDEISAPYKRLKARAIDENWMEFDNDK